MGWSFCAKHGRPTAKHMIRKLLCNFILCPSGAERKYYGCDTPGHTQDQVNTRQPNHSAYHFRGRRVTVEAATEKWVTSGRSRFETRSDHTNTRGIAFNDMNVRDWSGILRACSFRLSQGLCCLRRTLSWYQKRPGVVWSLLDAIDENSQCSTHSLDF